MVAETGRYNGFKARIRTVNLLGRAKTLRFGDEKAAREKQADLLGADADPDYEGPFLDFMLRILAKKASYREQVQRILTIGFRKQHGLAALQDYSDYSKDPIVVEAVSCERFASYLMRDLVEFWTAMEEPCWGARPGLFQEHVRELASHKRQVGCLVHEVAQWRIEETALRSLRQRSPAMGEEDEDAIIFEKKARLQEFWPQYRDVAHKVGQRGSPVLRGKVGGPTEKPRSGWPDSPEESQVLADSPSVMWPAPEASRDSDLRRSGGDWKSRAARSEVPAGSWDWARTRPQTPAGLRRQAPPFSQSEGSLWASQSIATDPGSTCLPRPGSSSLGARPARHHGSSTLLPSQVLGDGFASGPLGRPRSVGAPSGTCGSTASCECWTTEAFSVSRQRQGVTMRSKIAAHHESRLKNQKKSHRWWQNPPFTAGGVAVGVTASSKVSGAIASPPSRRSAPIQQQKDSTMVAPLALEVYEPPWQAGALQASASPPDVPTRRYLEVCESEGIVPMAIPFVTGCSQRLQAKGKALTDADLAAMAGMVEHKGTEIQEVDLEGHATLSEGALERFIQALRKADGLVNLARLSLSRCVQAGHSAPLAALVDLVRNHTRMSNLRQLDLSSVPLGLNLQVPLCRSIGQHHALRSVILADTGLGTGVKTAGTNMATQCIAALFSSTTISHLSLAWNCFTEEVFRHMGQLLAAGQVLQTLEIARCASSVNLGEDMSPLAVLLEQLSDVRSLTALDVSLNRLDFRAALILEDALEQSAKMTELDASHNPLGELGTRCLLRLLARATSGLTRFTFGSCTGGELIRNYTHHQVYSATNPSGPYTLDLSHPYHRSLLRMLYKTAERFHICPADAMRDIVGTPKYKHPEKDRRGIYRVPKKGKVSLMFSLKKAVEMSLAAGTAAGDTLESFNEYWRTTRVRFAPNKVVPLLALFASIEQSEEEQRGMLQALSKDFLLTRPQLEVLCQSSRNCMEVLSSVLFCVPGGAPTRFLSMLLPKTLEDYIKVVGSLRVLWDFNLENPTGRYRLDMSSPVDFGVAARLVHLDCWEAATKRALHRVDTSQYGNQSMVRNARCDEQPLGSLAISQWRLPDHGILEFDYSSCKRPSADATTLDDTTFSTILASLQQVAIINVGHRLRALRAVSHHLYLRSLQLREILTSFREEPARIECVVVLFNRITDVYNAKVFVGRLDSEVGRLRERLGHATFFPFVQPEQAQFSLDLNYHDQRVAMHCIVALAAKEEWANLRRPHLVRPDGSVDDLVLGVPQSWEARRGAARWRCRRGCKAFDKLPKGGQFQVTYMCRSNSINFRRRCEDIVRCGCWPPPREEDVKWSSYLSQAPEDVFDFVEFLTAHYDSIDEPIEQMDCLAHDGVLSHNEFAEGCRIIGYTKIQGPREKERLEALFDFLDVGSKGRLSVEEAADTLEQLFEEVKLSILEFVKFCERNIGNNLVEVWSALVGFGNLKLQLSKEQWSKACEDFDYFGAATPIFHFLDQADDGWVDLEKFKYLSHFQRRRAKSVLGTFRLGGRRTSLAPNLEKAGSRRGSANGGGARKSKVSVSDMLKA